MQQTDSGTTYVQHTDSTIASPSYKSVRTPLHAPLISNDERPGVLTWISKMLTWTFEMLTWVLQMTTSGDQGLQAIIFQR